MIFRNSHNKPRFFQEKKKKKQAVSGGAETA
jgi:hypothetical protein